MATTQTGPTASQSLGQESSDGQNLSASELEKLAEIIVESLRREAEIERDRLGW